MALIDMPPPGTPLTEVYMTKEKWRRCRAQGIRLEGRNLSFWADDRVSLEATIGTIQLLAEMG